MLGRLTPWFFLYRWIPGFAMFRFPARLIVLVAFFAAIAAGLGLTALARFGGTRARSRRM